MFTHPNPNFRPNFKNNINKIESNINIKSNSYIKTFTHPNPNFRPNFKNNIEKNIKVNPSNIPIIPFIPVIPNIINSKNYIIVSSNSNLKNVIKIKN